MVVIVTTEHDERILDDLRHTLTGIAEHVSKYSLADAIREGSSCTEQKVGGWRGDDGEACALSAAVLAVKARGLL